MLVSLWELLQASETDEDYVRKKRGSILRNSNIRCRRAERATTCSFAQLWTSCGRKLLTRWAHSMGTVVRTLVEIFTGGAKRVYDVMAKEKTLTETGRSQAVFRRTTEAPHTLEHLQF